MTTNFTEDSEPTLVHGADGSSGTGHVLLDRKVHGIAYTPTALAEYVASKVTTFFLRDQSSSDNGEMASSPEWRILDPACGEGELLVASWHQLKRNLAASMPAALVKMNPSELLCGIDIDERAVEQTSTRIGKLVQPERKSLTTNKIVVANALSPSENGYIEQGWAKLRARFNAPQGFDIIIANPPWGADISAYRHRILKSNFSLFQGQFDTSDLFVELALTLLKPGGFLAFIVPDSLFGLERKGLRKLLALHTQIRLIARLGEKFFENINRACSVIICQKLVPNPNSNVECLRLTPAIRRQILEGTTSLRHAEQRLLHLVPQARFLSNRDFAFDIDVTSGEELTMARLKALPRTIGDYLRSSRGVELSKFGQACQCRSCGKWMAKPSRTHWFCPHCGSKSDLSTAFVDCIVSEKQKKGYAPFLVGESIRRYAIGAPLWIRTNCEGIKYKDPALYCGPKLLVRKTGVGLSASIDYSGASTNQVVYIFRRLKQFEDTLPLELFLAVMNSRAMYYFIVKQHGETEWRSHPYVTQTQILNLPLPDLTKACIHDRDTVKKVSRLLGPSLVKREIPSTIVDAKIERLVARLLGLNEKDYKAIFRTLESLEGLLPVRALRRISIGDVFMAE